MNKIVALENNRSWKSLLIQNDRLLLINKHCNQVEAFLQCFNSESINYPSLKTRIIYFSEISRIIHKTDKPEDLYIYFPATKIILNFVDSSQVEEVAVYIKQEKNLIPSVQVNYSSVEVLMSIMALFVIYLKGWSIFKTVVEIDKRNLTDLGANEKVLVWFNGPTLILIAVLLMSYAIIYNTYLLLKNLISPPQIFLYD